MWKRLLYFTILQNNSQKFFTILRFESELDLRYEGNKTVSLYKVRTEL